MKKSQWTDDFNDNSVKHLRKLTPILHIIFQKLEEKHFPTHSEARISLIAKPEIKQENYGVSYLMNIDMQISQTPGK